jgi:GNAT superfamily N-acetyltransferase
LSARASWSPVLAELSKDGFESFGELRVVHRVLIEVLADVVPDRVLHLRRLSARRCLLADVFGELGIGDGDRGDLGIDAQGDHVLVNELDRSPVGMASLYEYRRMPQPGRADSRWGYLGNLFVRKELRNRGIGGALLTAVIAAARDRGYVRLVLSPSDREGPLFWRGGFLVPDDSVGADRLLLLPLATQ